MPIEAYPSAADDVHIAAVVSPDADAADQAERNQATQSSKASPAAVPDEASCAASSLPGGHNTPERPAVSASLEWRIYHSMLEVERCEAAFTVAEANLAKLKIGTVHKDVRSCAVAEAVQPMQEELLLPGTKRCVRCDMMIAITDGSLCTNCFYATNESFKCDCCGYHETEVGGLDRRSGSKLFNECFDYFHN